MVARAPSRQGFTPTWLKKFDWLLYDKADDSMACRLCRQHGVSTVPTAWRVDCADSMACRLCRQHGVSTVLTAAKRERVDSRHADFSRQEFGAARL